MKQILYALTLLMTLALAACRPHLDIQGDTSLPELEGKTLYLRVFEEDDLQVKDSATIVHGRFRFTGVAPDSAMMAILFLDDLSILPVVVEDSPLKITLSENLRRVEGSALNDSLFEFIKRKAVLDEQLAELPRRESRMILDGFDHGDILRLLNQQAAILHAQEDELVTRFIKDNMDNVLAPGVFMIVTSSLPYPVLNPQIEELVALGSPRFLNDPYVKEYLRLARENMEKMEE